MSYRLNLMTRWVGALGSAERGEELWEFLGPGGLISSGISCRPVLFVY